MPVESRDSITPISLGPYSTSKQPIHAGWSCLGVVTLVDDKKIKVPPQTLTRSGLQKIDVHTFQKNARLDIDKKTYYVTVLEYCTCSAPYMTYINNSP